MIADNNVLFYECKKLRNDLCHMDLGSLKKIKWLQEIFLSNFGRTTKYRRNKQKKCMKPMSRSINLCRYSQQVIIYAKG